jgi:hypothetical protein
MPIEQQDEVGVFVGVASDRPGRVGGGDQQREATEIAPLLSHAEELAMLQCRSLHVVRTIREPGGRSTAVGARRFPLPCQPLTSNGSEPRRRCHDGAA